MKKIWIGLAIFFVVAGVAGMIADSGSTKKKAEEMRNYPVISRQDLDSYMSQSPAQEMIVTDISPVGTLVQDTQGGIEGSFYYLYAKGERYPEEDGLGDKVDRDSNWMESEDLSYQVKAEDLTTDLGNGVEVSNDSVYGLPELTTYYPNGEFEGFLVPHEETITIAKSLEVKNDKGVAYRPSVMFIYSPCEFARKYFNKAKVNEYPYPDPNKPADCENENGQTIVRGYVYPKNSEIVYKEKIKSGTEYVGVLIIGENFDPVWVGNRIEMSFLYKNPKESYWQTPTITPVAMSALAAVCWMIKNKDKGDIYFPDDINDYKYIIKIAEKYISKTIYRTFDKNTLEESLKINFSNLQSKDLFI